MTLLDLEIASLRNKTRLISGMDSPDQCLDKKHFQDYPYTITYQFNSRGFRDDEWPKDLKSAVWCIGDSFTAGLGSPREHTWPYVLQQQSGRRCINISLDGASNNWIARRAAQIVKKIAPVAVVVQWSFLNRREADVYTAWHAAWNQFYPVVKDLGWPTSIFSTVSDLPPEIQAELSMHDQPLVDDFTRQRHFSKDSRDQDIKNTMLLWNLLESFVDRNQTKMIYSAIPQFAPAGDIDKFSKLAPVPFTRVQQLDRARDGYHYDIKTAESFVQQILPLLK
jgi:hypothetical protein